MTPAPTPDTPNPHVESMRVAQLIYAIDSEWEEERERYTFRRASGLVIEPSYWNAAIVGAIAVGAGVLTVVTGNWQETGAGAGVLLLGAAGLGYHAYSYGQAHERYCQRRQAALDSARVPILLNPDGEFKVRGKL